MTTRLMALVMLPVTVMCGLAGSVVLSHRSAATHAVAVGRGISVLNEMVALRDGLQAQLTVEAFSARALQAGSTLATVSAFIGFDVTSQFAPSRDRATQAALALGNTSPVSAATLQSLFADIDATHVSPAEAIQRLSGYIALTVANLTRGLDQLETQIRNVPLLVGLESLQAASDLVHAAPSQIIDLSTIWFPLPGDTPQARAATLARFGQESANYGAAVVRIHELGDKHILASLARIETNPEIRAFDQATAAALRGEPLLQASAPLDTVKSRAAFRGALARDTLLEGLVTTATTAVRDAARHLAASERNGFVLWTFGTAALALASIGIALRLARTISNPLKDLADYAHAVNEGQLDAEPSPSRNHGPRETRVAFGVFADLVANLQLLDAKANALALCDFDNPVLGEPLPGRLGRSLESSVALLSGSILERDQLQTHLAHQATHDSLTGIYNRAAAIIGIEAAVRRAVRTRTTTALLFVDLNEFKAVNDSHGHEVGDEVLRQVASRITGALRSDDFAARLGGDEFLVVAEGITGVADANDLAGRIIDTISRPIEIGDLRINIGAAIGIAMGLDGPDEPLRLLARADAAMYRAKHHDRSAIEVFDADLQEQLTQHDEVEVALTAALADPAGGGLRLHYQPVLHATTGCLVGAEALIRWERPGRGLLSPDSFIPVAETSALIIDLDCWVLDRAARQLNAWSDSPELGHVPVAVNISGRHLLSRQLPNHIRAVLDRTGVDPHRLTIEITETVLLTDLVAAAAELDAVRSLGIRVAIDDFGTGYTSLAHLQQLPIDTIKIDRSFISQLNAQRGRSLVRMVTDLGHAIDLDIVAEGVETPQEMTALQTMGADHLQGYLLSKPLEPAALSTWAQQRTGKRPQLPGPSNQAPPSPRRCDELRLEGSVARTG